MYAKFNLMYITKQSGLLIARICPVSSQGTPFVRFCSRAIVLIYLLHKGGDSHGPDKVSTESQDEPVRASIPEMEGEEADGRANRGISSLHSPGQKDARKDISSLHRPYRDEGSKLFDRRLGAVSHNRASRQETSEVVALYKGVYPDRNVAHFYEAYTERHGGRRCYNWVKRCLYSDLPPSGVARRPRGGGVHRERRERKEQSGMMIHQDASTHRWVPQEVWDLVVTMDDATGEIYSAFFVWEEGTWSSMRGVRDVLEREGIFTSFYSDRGPHYWSTPKMGGRVDKDNPTQFGRAMAELGVVMIPGYSPEARGRSERMFGTLQGRLPAELCERGIVEMEEANRFLAESFIEDFNRRFMVVPAEEGEAFVPLLDAKLDDILCLKYPRVVGNDNCVRYKGMSLQIPAVEDRDHKVTTS